MHQMFLRFTYTQKASVTLSSTCSCFLVAGHRHPGLHQVRPSRGPAVLLRHRAELPEVRVPRVQRHVSPPAAQRPGVHPHGRAPNRAQQAAARGPDPGRHGQTGL